MSTPKVALYALVTFAIVFLSGCLKPQEGGQHEPLPGNSGDRSKMPDHEEASSGGAEVSTVRSQLYLSKLLIKQWHVRQPEPVQYSGHRLSQVRLDYGVHHTGELFLRRVVVSLSDGSVETHTPMKGMSVTFGVNGGRARKPVEIVQCIYRSNP